ncbi:MAG: oligosaccharide flippase family protein [Bacteroidota bacterium]
MKRWGFELGKRTRTIYKNIILALPIKGGSAVISLVMISLLYSYLKPEIYGIWITIFTVFNWIGLLDLGLDNGLRNHLVSALTASNHRLAKEYISTVYISIGVISAAVFLIMLVPITSLDWVEVLNIPHTELDLPPILILVCFLFAIRFTLQVLLSVLIAHQDIYKADLINFLSSLSSLVLIFIVVQLEYNQGSLYTVILINMLTPIIVYLIASGFFYTRRFRNISPSFAAFRMKHLKSLLHLGLNFLWIRINGLILLQSAYLIINLQMGPAEVASYSIVFNYFHSIQFLFNIFINPYWPAVTEAINKKDLKWIKQSLKKVRLLFLFFLLAIFILFLSANTIIPIWLNKPVVFENGILLLMSIYMTLNIWKGIHSFFLNGMSIVKIQTIVSSFTALGFLILAFIFIDIYGLLGVVLASVIVGIPRAIIYALAVNKEIR